jgi:hypothetical protein
MMSTHHAHVRKIQKRDATRAPAACASAWCSAWCIRARTDDEAVHVRVAQLLVGRVCGGSADLKALGFERAGAGRAGRLRVGARREREGGDGDADGALLEGANECAKIKAGNGKRIKGARKRKVGRQRRGAARAQRARRRRCTRAQRGCARAPRLRARKGGGIAQQRRRRWRAARRTGGALRTPATPAAVAVAVAAAAAAAARRARAARRRALRAWRSSGGRQRRSGGRRCEDAPRRARRAAATAPAWPNNGSRVAAIRAAGRCVAALRCVASSPDVASG